MFHHPAWAVGSYSSGPPAEGTPQILVNPTQVHEQMRHAVQGDSGGRIPRFVDLDLGSSPGWWAATIATYCPSKMVEHPKSKSTQPRS